MSLAWSLSVIDTVHSFESSKAGIANNVCYSAFLLLGQLARTRKLSVTISTDLKVHGAFTHTIAMGDRLWETCGWYLCRNYEEMACKLTSILHLSVPVRLHRLTMSEDKRATKKRKISSDGGYDDSAMGVYDDAFVFSLVNPAGAPPAKYCVEDPAQPSVYNFDNYGPCFGGSGSEGIYCALDGDYSSALFPRNYVDTTGRGDATFTGASTFTIEKMEVWGVKSLKH